MGIAQANADIDVTAMVMPDRIHGRLYYDPALFNRAYDWMKARGMTEGQSQHAALVVG